MTLHVINIGDSNHVRILTSNVCVIRICNQLFCDFFMITLDVMIHDDRFPYEHWGNTLPFRIICNRLNGLDKEIGNIPPSRNDLL